MATEIKVPALGESITEGTLGKWLKQPGDAVAVDDPLATVETVRRIPVRVRSPVAGVLEERRAEVGDTVRAGAVVAVVDEGATSREAARIEGEITRGERLEVELWVDGERVATARRGDSLVVQTADGPLEVAVSSLSLDELRGESVKGTWAELAKRPEAALVSNRSPAPHTKAKLVVRRLAPGARVAVEGVITGHRFEGSSTNRVAAARRPRGAVAVRLASRAPTSQPRPRESGRGLWGAVLWAITALWLLLDGAVAYKVGTEPVLLVSGACAIAVVLAARFVDRALLAPPAMDHEMAGMLTRFFARGARSVPRFAPFDRDATRWIATILGPMVVLAWLYVVFVCLVWVAGTLLGDVRVDRFSPAGASTLTAGVAASLLLMSVGYALADLSEVKRARALLAALRGGDWRAVEGVVGRGAGKLLSRTVTIESDSTPTDDPMFFARTQEEGDELRVVTEHGDIYVDPASLRWASDDWQSLPKGAARMRVRAGLRALVAGFRNDGRLEPRGPASMMLFASRSDPAAVLRRALRRRWLDAAAALLGALLVGLTAILLAAMR